MNRIQTKSPYTHTHTLTRISFSHDESKTKEHTPVLYENLTEKSLNLAPTRSRSARYPSTYGPFVLHLTSVENPRRAYARHKVKRLTFTAELRKAATDGVSKSKMSPCRRIRPSSWRRGTCRAWSRRAGPAAGSGRRGGSPAGGPWGPRGAPAAPRAPGAARRRRLRPRPPLSGAPRASSRWRSRAPQPPWTKGSPCPGESHVHCIMRVKYDALVHFHRPVRWMSNARAGLRHTRDAAAGTYALYGYRRATDKSRTRRAQCATR